MNFLRENGVSVNKKQRVSIAGELAKTASEEAQHRWANDKIAKVLNKDESFNSSHHPECRCVRTLSFHFGNCLPEALPSGQLLAQQPEERQNIEDYYQNFDISK